VTVTCGFQPSVVRVPINLFFQRIEDAQPWIGSKTGYWN
jgi:hypothetical protein